MVTTIKYNNSIIANLESGQIATLLCTNKNMLTDTEIYFAEPGTMKYGDIEFAAAAGQTLKLPCKDKRMKYDVIVSISDEGKDRFILSDGTKLVTVDGEKFTIREN